MRILVVTSLSILIELVRASSLIQELDTRLSPTPDLVISAPEFSDAPSFLTPLKCCEGEVDAEDEEYFSWRYFSSATDADEKEEVEDFYSRPSSIVSESFLEELGLRSSRSSTPITILHSPSQNNLKKFPSISSMGLLRQISVKSDFYDIENEKAIYEANEEEEHYRIGLGFIDLESPEEELELEEMELISLKTAEEEVMSFKEAIEQENVSVIHIPVLSLPDVLLYSILDYYDDQSLRGARLVSKKFKESCDEYLKLLANLSLNIEASSKITFVDIFYLSSTMLPLYRNVPQIRRIFSASSARQDDQVVDDPQQPILSILEISKLRNQKIELFSDSFISNVLVPNLSKFKLKNSPLTTEPHPLFLLSEAVIKCKRFELFERSLVPALNELSSKALIGTIAPPNFISPGFIDFVDNQSVLGATLHAFIDFNLNLTVCYLIRTHPQLISLKNHFGLPALLRVIDLLRSSTVELNDPDPEVSIDEWTRDMEETFMSGYSIQQQFKGNSRLGIEMFLNILLQSADRLGFDGEIIDFLGLNTEFSIATLASSNIHFNIRKTCLVNELIAARQYDLLMTLGYHLGSLIVFPVDANPLVMSAEMKNPTIISILLKYYKSVDVNYLTPSGITPLGLAVAGREAGLNSIRVLLNDARVDPNLHRKIPPLIKAIELGLNASVALLLSHPSIDISFQIIVNKRPLSPLICCLNRRNWPSLKLLLQHPSSHLFNDDISSLKILREIESFLINLENAEPELLMLVKRAIMPTIEEETSK